MSVYIDHIYDLQHNSGFILNKNDMYKGSWVDKSLDMKLHANDLDEFLHGVSPWVRSLAQRVIYSDERRGYDKKGIFDPSKKRESVPLKNGGWNTNWYSGVGGEGEEEDDVDRDNHEKVDEVDGDRNNWNSKYRHCKIHYETDYSNGGVRFEWSGNMDVSINMFEFEGGDKNINDWEDVGDLKDHIREAGYSIYDVKKKFYSDDEELELILFIEGDSGDNPNDFYRFGDKVMDDYDNGYEIIKSIIRSYFINNGYMVMTPSRKLISSLDHDPDAPSPWKHFTWDYEDNGKFEVSCDETLGVSQIMSVDDPDVVKHLKQSIERLLENRINNLAKNIQQQGFLPGMEKPQAPSFDDYPLDLLNVSVKIVRDEHPAHPAEFPANTGYKPASGGRVFSVHIKMAINDSHSAEEVRKFRKLVDDADELIPQFIQQGTQIVHDYDEQYIQWRQSKTLPGIVNRDKYGNWISPRTYDYQYWPCKFKFKNPFEKDSKENTPFDHPFRPGPNVAEKP